MGGVVSTFRSRGLRGGWPQATVSVALWLGTRSALGGLRLTGTVASGTSFPRSATLRSPSIFLNDLSPATGSLASTSQPPAHLSPAARGLGSLRAPSLAASKPGRSSRQHGNPTGKRHCPRPRPRPGLRESACRESARISYEMRATTPMAIADRPAALLSAPRSPRGRPPLASDSPGASPTWAWPNWPISSRVFLLGALTAQGKISYWSSLWYVLPTTSTFNSQPGQFRVVPYLNTTEVPAPNWVFTVSYTHLKLPTKA